MVKIIVFLFKVVLKIIIKFNLIIFDTKIIDIQAIDSTVVILICFKPIFAYFS